MLQSTAKWLFAALTVTAAAVLVVYFLRLKAQPEPAPVTQRDAPTTITETKQTFDPSYPTSFFAVSDIVALGDEAVEPLVALAESDDLVDQWTSAVALGSIRRNAADQNQIYETMRTLYESPYESVRVYAAMSNAEFDDFSGLNILLEALESESVMTYMEPPTLTAAFSNRVLEFVSGQDVGFDEASTPEDEQTAVAAWQAWAQTK